MRFFTTGGTGPASWRQIMLQPMDAQQRLYLPEVWPTITDEALKSCANFCDVAFMLLSHFIDLPGDVLRRIIERAYNASAFGTDAIVPVIEIGTNGDTFLVMASEGPSWSFKDIALRLLAQLLQHVLEETNSYIIVVVATSGDTGSAVIAAMRGLSRVKVVVLSPRGGSMSKLQRAQMYGVNDPFVINLAVEGSFDDCQLRAKDLLGDSDLQARGVTAANSINFIRVLAQEIYYFEACRVMKATSANPVHFIVPSGNAGNIVAGHGARSCNAPIGMLYAATNKNYTLHTFIQSGLLEAIQKQDSLSPSMDIAFPNNWERVLFDVFGRDAALVQQAMDALKAKQPFSFAEHADFPRFQTLFGSQWVTDAETKQAIYATLRKYKLFVDPHTAVGMHVLSEIYEPGKRYAVIETAQAGKFRETIHEATGEMPPLPPGAKKLLAAGDFSVTVPNDFATIKREVLARF